MPLQPCTTWDAIGGILVRPGRNSGDPVASEPFSTVTINSGSLSGFGASPFGISAFGQ